MPAGDGCQVLALDFDGVICDSLHECVLVSWNSHFGYAVADFGADGLTRIPQAYLDHFRASRGYARCLGHFLLPLLGGPEVFGSQAEFDAAYRGLPERLVTRFVERAERYRSAVRQHHRRSWLRLHTLYPGVLDVVRHHRPYLVTARDRESVVELLAAGGVSLDPSRVYGNQVDKRRALADIVDREGISPRELWFVDDNLPTVMAAGRAGFTARWARWGFAAPEHGPLARRLGVPSIDLPWLVGLIPGSVPAGVHQDLA
jgi:phosphoglycolate phosphatase-like HAD superfamily hydrolase